MVNKFSAGDRVRIHEGGKVKKQILTITGKKIIDDGVVYWHVTNRVYAVPENKLHKIKIILK